MLTPCHKREPMHYPTKSLRVCPRSQPVYCGVARAFSCDRKVGPTDFCASEDNVLLEEELRPQVVPLKGVPWLAFRHLRGTESKINVQFLVDVWTYSYEQCRQNIDIICTEPPGHIRLVPKSEQGVILDHQAALLRIFSPHLAKVWGLAMRNFVPSRPMGPDWSPDQIAEQLRILRTAEDAFQANSNLRDNCYILLAIVLGSLYGVISNTCRDRNQTYSLDSEVAFQPDIIYRKRFKTWTTIICLPLASPPSYRDWNLMVLEMVLGRKATDLNRWYADGDSVASQTGEDGIASSTQLPIGTVLGAQANGMAAVVDLLVRPSFKPQAVSTFHITRGQLLSFPVGQHGYVEASEGQELGLTMTLNADPNSRLLKITPRDTLDASMRIDAEPCWEGNPQTVVLRCRRDGMPLCPLNIKTIISRLQQTSVPCTCGQPGLSSTMSTGSWSILGIDNLTRRTFTGSLSRRIDVRGEISEPCNVFVDASQSEAATLYALGALQCQDILICQGCLTCLEKRHRQRWRKSNCVVVNAATRAN